MQSWSVPNIVLTAWDLGQNPPLTHLKAKTRMGKEEPPSTTCPLRTVSSRHRTWVMHFLCSRPLDHILGGLPACGGPGLAPKALCLWGLWAAAEWPGVHRHQGAASMPNLQQVQALLKGCPSIARTHRIPPRRKARCAKAILMVWCANSKEQKQWFFFQWEYI